MFDIGWTEILVIAVVAIVVVGPKDLPRVLRTLAQTIGQVRRMAGEFQNTFNEALKEAELADLKKDVESIKDAATFKDIRSSLDPIRHLDDQFRSEMSGSAISPAKTSGNPGPAAAGSALEGMTEAPEPPAAAAQPASATSPTGAAAPAGGAAPAGEATKTGSGADSAGGGTA
ncbi:MAG: Sec-independent protein translocase protein TatB [Hyphomicrobiales bacterium]